jgi:hypothetical protein
MSKLHILLLSGFLFLSLNSFSQTQCTINEPLPSQQVHPDFHTSEHIPLGSTHWATVSEDKKMYYMWMDFFLTKEGQEWLKTHKPISKKMD